MFGFQQIDFTFFIKYIQIKRSERPVLRLTENFLNLKWKSGISGSCFYNKNCLNWRAQSKNDPLIFRPFLKVFRSSWILACGHFQKWPKNQGIVLALSPPINFTWNLLNSILKVEQKCRLAFSCSWQVLFGYKFCRRFFLNKVVIGVCISEMSLFMNGKKKWSKHVVHLNLILVHFFFLFFILHSMRKDVFDNLVALQVIKKWWIWWF